MKIINTFKSRPKYWIICIVWGYKYRTVYTNTIVLHMKGRPSTEDGEKGRDGNREKSIDYEKEKSSYYR